jgi:predicted PhzF superfamily epimerase YddE/YHI9
VGALRYFQIDAFTTELFRGNPAGVCILENDWLPDALMQRIALENQQSETAFVLPKGNTFGIRWFSPEVEIDLCGHATLAAAFVIFNELNWSQSSVEFSSQSGPLKVARVDDYLELDFPARPGNPTAAPAILLEGLGASPSGILKSRDWLFVFDSEATVRALQPNFDLLRGIPGAMVIVTAPGQDVDFVSRFFAPSFGIDEDPVTGSSHCTLIPYWAARLGKNKLRARQVSARGGELFCELRGDRVGIGGHAVKYSSGHLHL